MRIILFYIESASYNFDNEILDPNAEKIVYYTHDMSDEQVEVIKCEYFRRFLKKLMHKVVDVESYQQLLDKLEKMSKVF